MRQAMRLRAAVFGGGCAVLAAALPVQAASAVQGTYSNASLKGVYALTLFNVVLSTRALLSELGKIEFDGGGNIVGGRVLAYAGQASPTCHFTLSGTYQVRPRGNAVAFVTPTPADTDPPMCNLGTHLRFTAQVAQDGQTALFNQADGTSLVVGIALKQFPISDSQ